MRNDDRGSVLLSIARDAIAQSLGRASAMPGTATGWLLEPGASFVTLTRDGALRGCVGSLQARCSLLDDIRTNAVGAARRDPRFVPLTIQQLDAVRVGVSVLSPLQTLEFEDEADALSQLRPGIDGLVLACHGRRSTFLPQVWDQLPTPRQFLCQLKAKLGCAEDFWDAAITLQRYSVSQWKEVDAGVEGAPARPGAHTR